MAYVCQQTGEPMTMAEVRTALPGLSIPAGADLREYGFAHLEMEERPKTNDGDILMETPPEEHAPGRWKQSWIVFPATQNAAADAAE